MSFILDALRKSEQERQRNQGPGIADVRVHRAGKKQTFWLPLVMLLVGVNLSLLIFLWVKADPEADSAQPVPVQTEQAPVTMPEQPERTEPAAIAPAQERSLAGALPAPAPDTAVAAAAGAPAANPEPGTLTAPLQAAPTQAAPANNQIPSLAELQIAGIVSLPPLRIDIHVYSDAAAERFVFINMTKYREGDELREGPLVDAITRDGVILVQDGNEFVITRE